MFESLFDPPAMKQIRKMRPNTQSVVQNLVLISDFLNHTLMIDVLEGINKVEYIGKSEDVIDCIIHYSILSLTYEEISSESNIMILRDRQKNFDLIKSFIYAVLVNRERDIPKSIGQTKAKYRSISSDSTIAFHQMLAISLEHQGEEYSMQVFIRMGEIFKKWNVMAHIGLSGANTGIARLDEELKRNRLRENIKAASPAQVAVYIKLAEAIEAGTASSVSF